MSEEGRRGLLIVLSGPSGVGKDVAIARLKERGFDIYYVVTATTRERRENEVDGRDYFFLTRAQFEETIARDGFLEWSNVYGNLYGPPIAQVREKLAEGRDVLLKIDVQGAEKVRVRARDGVFIFLAPPSLDELVTRLRARRTESEAELEVRVDNAYKEMAAIEHYDYAVVNHDGQLDEAVEAIGAIITAERLRVHPRQPEIY
ncbi:MAG: guanylate kinase [Chloroflexi bacterium]|nr:guanylate kinase [Chloroflexota bacterium]